MGLGVGLDSGLGLRCAAQHLKRLALLEVAHLEGW